MGYSIASGEIRQIGATAVTDGITEASTVEIGDTTLHDVSYNEKIAGNIKSGEHVALMLTPVAGVAQDFDAGVRAFDAGDYATALRANTSRGLSSSRTAR